MPTTLEQKLKAAQDQFPIGRTVRFFPVASLAEFEESKVRSAPWAVGGGAIVVAIEGRVGGVMIDHLEVI